MAEQDTTPPTLSFFTLPKSINVTKNDQLASFTAGAADTGSGVASVTLVLDHAIRSNGMPVSSLYFSASADPFSDGMAKLTQRIDGSTGAGTYTVTDAFVTDMAGNQSHYDTAALSSLHIDTHFTVKSATAMDVDAPMLTSLGLPRTVNVNKHDQTVTFTAGATDKGLGVDYVSLQLDHTIQSHGYATNYLTFTDSSDSFSDGQSSLSQQIDSTTAPGVYTINYAYVGDQAGNTTMYTARQLADLGIGTQFTVRSQAPVDTTPPVLTGLSLPKTVNVTKGDQVAAFTAKATDQGLGVASVQVHLDHAIQSNGNATSYLFIGQGSDSFADGQSTLSQTIDRTTAAGVYTVDELFVTDKAGNSTLYHADQLAGLGFDTHLTVRSANHTSTVVGNEPTPYGHAGGPAAASFGGWHMPSDGSILHVA